MPPTHVDGPSNAEPTTVAALLLVATSGLVSLLARPALGDTVRIRWSVGTYYGPETAPAILVLAAFPVVAAVAFAGFQLLRDRLDGTVSAADDDGTRVVEAGSLAVVGAVLLIQVTLVAANLFL